MAEIKVQAPGLRVSMALGDYVLIDGEIEIQLIRDGGGKTRLRIYDPKKRTIHRRGPHPAPVRSSAFASDDEFEL